MNKSLPKLNTVLTFQERKETNGDGYGNYRAEWENRFKRWSYVAEPSLAASDEEVIAAALVSTTSFEIEVRNDSETRTICSSWRVLLFGEALAIKSVSLPDPHTRAITMIVQRGVAT